MFRPAWYLSVFDGASTAWRLDGVGSMASRRTYRRDDVGERETRHRQRKTVTTQARLRTDFERVEDRIRQATRRLGRVASAPPVPPARPPPAPRQTGRDRSPPRPPPGDVDLLVGEQRVQLQVRRPARDSRWPSFDTAAAT